MKKMIVFFILIVSLLFTDYSPKDTFGIFKEVQSVLIVTSKEAENVDKLIENGDEFYYLFEGDKAPKILEKLELFDDIKGINLYFSCDLDLSYFKTKLDYMTDKTDVEGSDVYYGYYTGYKEFEFIDGKKINVQLAKTDDNWVLGFPMILTGF